jgi:hypothetical protein
MMKFNIVAIAVLALLANPVVAQPAAGITISTTAYCGHKGLNGCPGIDPLNAPAGEKVTICYEVKNTGKSTVESVAVKDTGLVVGVGTLAPGAKTTVFAEKTSTIAGTGRVTGMALVNGIKVAVADADPYTVHDKGKDYSAGCDGDPHFKTWGGHHYDYHGECDLVLLHNAAFESGMGIDVHIRTKIRRDMSYISSAALKIGKDVLEVAAHRQAAHV